MIDSKYSSVQRACAGFTQEPGNGIEWYFPERLSIDLIRAMQYVRRTPVTDYLGLRPWHLREIDTPLYFFETGLSKGQGAKGTRRFFHSSNIPRRRSSPIPGWATSTRCSTCRATTASRKPWCRSCAK